VDPDDGFNTVRIVGRDWNDELTVAPDAFGEVIAVAPDALVDGYVLIEDAPATPALATDGGNSFGAWVTGGSHA
jgi:uncharacterized FlgJ-related protein